MAIFKSLLAKNYRGFEEIEIDDFGKINLFIGNNNSGKTSILESLFLLTGISNPVLTTIISNLRGGIPQGAIDYKYFFYNMDLNKNPNFVVNLYDKSIRNLEIIPIFGSDFDSKTATTLEHRNQRNNTNTSLKINGLNFLFSIKKYHEQLQKYHSSISFNSGGISTQTDKKYTENLGGSFLTPGSKDELALEKYSNIIKTRRTKEILEVFKLIQPDIEEIHALPDGIYFSLKGKTELMPSKIMGDGIRRFLNIITSIFERQNNIVLIDEIESGLHFSAHKILWESILLLIKDLNVQLFITTHNLESLTHLKDALALDSNLIMRDQARVFSLSLTQKDGLKTYKYNYDSLKDSLDKGIEIRL